MKLVETFHEQDLEIKTLIQFEMINGKLSAQYAK